MKHKCFQLILKKCWNARYENLSSGSQVVPYRWTDMMKLTVIFHNVVNVPKNTVIGHVENGKDSHFFQRSS
jgi:hypothetical protein